MNIKLLYFARIKELLNISTENIVVSDNINSIAELKMFLAERGQEWHSLFNGKQLVRAAINQTLVSDTAVLSDGDEVAFFPPVTGG